MIKGQTMNKYTTSLLNRVGAKNLENLSVEKLKRIFLLAINDFKNENIMLEELVYFASLLVQMPQTVDNNELEELKEAIHSCSEIGFYLHRIPEVDSEGKNTLSFLLETMKYHQKYKKLIM